MQMWNNHERPQQNENSFPYGVEKLICLKANKLPLKTNIIFHSLDSLYLSFFHSASHSPNVVYTDTG